MSFEDWRESQRANISGYTERDAYKAGAKSRQAEIDGLKKRINEVVEWIESNKENIPLSEWHGYTTQEYVDADDLLDILKGETK